MKNPFQHARARLALSFGAFLACLGLAACSVGGLGGSGGTASVTGSGAPAQGVPAGQTVKVALLLPLTGNANAQPVAKAMKQAGELALFDFDKPNVQLIPKDTHGNPDGARQAAQEAVKEGAELIIGPLFANEVSAVAPIAQAAHIPVIAFSSDRNVAGNGVYLLSFVAGADVPRMISYAVSKGKTRFAALFPQNEYGRLAEQAFQRAVQENHAQIVMIKTFPPDANGMLPPVKEMSQLAKKSTVLQPGKTDAPAQIDALFIPAGGDTLPSLAPLFPYYEMDTKSVKLMGLSGWDYPGAGKEPALLGGWFGARSQGLAGLHAPLCRDLRRRAAASCKPLLRCGEPCHLALEQPAPAALRSVRADPGKRISGRRRPVPAAARRHLRSRLRHHGGAEIRQPADRARAVVVRRRPVLSGRVQL